jgi:multisite-specific tRNA:(cytosine-C5)-methyltransferase
MVFPLWKSLHSLNLMLPKEERKALLLRLFNDETPLVNLTQKQKNATFPKVEPNLEGTESPLVGRNSSSPEGGVSLLDAVEEAIRQEDEAQGPDE